MFESLFKSYMSKVSGEDTENNFTPMNKKSFSFMKKTSDNFSVIKDIAKNIKESNEKIVQLVEIMGGQPKKDLSGDYFEEQDKKEEDIEASRLKPKKEKPKAEKKEKFSIFKLLRNIFEAILKTITTVLAVALAPAILIGIFVDSIKEMFLEFGKKIKDSLVEFFDGFVEKIQTWITDTVKPIIDGVKEFIDNMVETVSNFFGKIGDWFVEKFGFIKDIFEPVLSFISKVWDRFTSMLDGLKAKLKPLVEAALNFSGKDGKITKLFKSEGLDKFVGIGVEPKQITKEEDDAEKKKLERQQKEALDTERVREQEKKAQYTGDDEIVRKRHGIEDKTTTMRAEERKPAPTPAPKVEAKPAPKIGTAPAQIPKPETGPVPSAPTVTKPTTKEDLSPKPEGISSGGKFPDEQKFVESLKPWAKYVSDKIGGKVPPMAILGQWAGESGSGKSLPADYNYAGIKAGKKFQKGNFVLTEERYTNEQLKRAQSSGEDLAKVITSPTDTITKKGRQVTIDEWFGKGSFQKAKDEGKNWVQVKSYFAKFKDLKDFADSFASFISTPRYAKAREQTTAAGFGYEIAKAGYATAAAEKYSAKVAAFDQKYSSGGQISSASTEVASGQRQQQKPSTPVVVNAPTTNTTVVNNKQVASAPPPKDSSRALVSRAA
jgi:flagellum-specific peptidoglycan hydrolase FlgJ